MNSLAQIIRFVTSLALWLALTPVMAGEAPDCRDRDGLRQWPATAKPAAGKDANRKGSPYPEEYYIAIVEDEEIRVEYLDASRTGLVLPSTLAEFFDFEFDRSCLSECTEKGPACWWKCGYAKPGEDGPFTINSRGFVRTDYAFVWLARLDEKAAEFRKTGPFSVYHILRPNCGLKNGAHCRGGGVLLRKWGDSFYQVASLDLVEDAGGKLFVSPFWFDREARRKIGDLIVPLKIEFTGDGGCCCREAGDLTVRDYRDMKRSPFAGPDPKAKAPAEYMCVTHGIPVSRMDEALKRP